MSAARILVVDDEVDIRGLLQDILSDEGYEVDVAADAVQARRAIGRHEPDAVLLDIWMPDIDGISLLREWAENRVLSCPVVMMSGHGTVETAVEATRLGAFDFVEKPLSMAKLLRTVERALDAGRRVRQAQRAITPPLLAPVGRSRLMQQLRDQVQQVAMHRVPVLLVGEAGTGREALARYLHAQSPRAQEPFVVANGTDLEAASGPRLLRGREEGGRVVPGLYEQAARGTLFIQGLEELSPAAQAAFAADIDQGGFLREGGSERQPLTCRFVSAAQPGFELKSGEQLRRDLLSHLNVMTLRVPPLREYTEDVPELLRYYVERLVDEEHLPFRRFSVAAQNRLRNYPWPGNVHELRNLVQRLLILGGPEEIPLAEIERELAVQLPQNEPLVKQDLLALPLREAREQFERAYLQQQLLLCNGKVGQLAKRVGMERTHLYRKLRSLGVDFRQMSED